MEFYYRATPTRSSESILAAFHRLVGKYKVVSGQLFPQPRSLADLAPLRGAGDEVTAFVLHVPLRETASDHWRSAAERVAARGTDGLVELMLLYGTVEKTVEPWKKLGVSISTPIERSVSSGFEFVSGRAVLQVTLDCSRASARPAFRRDEERITKYLARHRSELYRGLPAAPARRGDRDGPRWGKPETRGGPTFLTNWLREHAALDHLSVHARGSAAALLEHADLFPDGAEPHVMAFMHEPVKVADALPMFEAKRYSGLLSYSAGVPDNPEGVGDLTLKLSTKGLELEISSGEELGPKVGKALGLKLELGDVD